MCLSRNNICRLSAFKFSETYFKRIRRLKFIIYFFCFQKKFCRCHQCVFCQMRICPVSGFSLYGYVCSAYCRCGYVFVHLNAFRYGIYKMKHYKSICLRSFQNSCLNHNFRSAAGFLRWFKNKTHITV